MRISYTQKALVIHKLHVNDSTAIVSRLIPLRNVKWMEFDEDHNELHLTYMNGSTDTYRANNKNDKSLKTVFSSLVRDIYNIEL